MKTWAAFFFGFLVSPVLLLPGCAKRTCPACETPPRVGLYAQFEVKPGEVTKTLFETFQKRRVRPSVLLLSGGGANGAWGAGFLNGWTASGTRPVFDVVTGISTGSLISSYALIGSSGDSELKNAYTTVSNDQIFKKRFLPTALFSASSLRTTGPLKNLLTKYISDQVVDAVGKIFRKEGRVLLVGTVNFDSGAMVIWNMTKLAASSEPWRYDAYRRILLAAAAIPVVFPPVEIDQSLHVDGGTREQIFGATLSDAYQNAYSLFLAAASRTGEVVVASENEQPIAHLIINGQLGLAMACPEPNILPLALRAVEVLLNEGMIGNLYKIQSKMPSFALKISRIPDSFQITSDSSDFDSKKMKDLFEAGFDDGRHQKWESKVEIP